jgi:hypothetical protein
MPSKDDNVCRELEVVSMNLTVRIFSTAKEDDMESLLVKAVSLFEKFKEGN